MELLFILNIVVNAVIGGVIIDCLIDIKNLLKK